MATCVTAVVASSVLAGAVAGAPAPHESAAQHLHRRGVHCMEVLERRDCAIEKFEALLEERTTERELVTDAMLRLIRLYDAEGRSEDVPELLRRFWDVGMKHGSSGHVPYSLRFFPSQLNVVVNIDTARVVQSPVIRSLGRDARDVVFTCDEARRNDARNALRWKRAARKAARQNRRTWEVAYEQMDEAKKRQQRAERRRARRGGRDDEGPIFVHAACPVAVALGHEDLLAWTRMTGAFNHHDSRQSLAVAQIPGLDARLSEAVAAGRLRDNGSDRWILPDLEFAGAPIHLARLDHEELVVAPAALVEDVVSARRKRRKQLNREVARLVREVPRDTGFFLVMNQAAMREMGFGNMKRSTRGVLEALLPRPKGLQIAAVFGDYAGLFTRVPTDNPVKARMLAQVANMMVARSAEDDARAARWLEGLDIAESSDRRALLASYLASTRQLEELFLDY